MLKKGYIIRDCHSCVGFKQNLSVWSDKREKGKLKILKRNTYIEHYVYAIYTINNFFPKHKYYLGNNKIINLYK